jgi:hypothetical protein
MFASAGAACCPTTRGRWIPWTTPIWEIRSALIARASTGCSLIDKVLIWAEHTHTHTHTHTYALVKCSLRTTAFQVSGNQLGLSAGVLIDRVRVS